MVARSLLVVLLALLSVVSARAEDRKLTFVFPQEKNAFHDAAAEIIRQAYASLGITVVYKTYPAERALRMSNEGLSDGELVRIKGIEAKYSNLIRIPVSHVTAEQMAFATDPSLKINGWKSLKPFRLVFHRGYKVAEQNTVGMDRYLTGTDVNAFRMVEKGRKDIAIANRFSGQKILQDEDLKHVVMLRPPVQRDPLYHYVHFRHRGLVEDITRALKSMKTEGKISKILERFGAPPLGD
jgi:polar amino acid transport system substrate-binding protein